MKKIFNKLRNALGHSSHGPWEYKDGAVYSPDGRVWDVADANDQACNAKFAVEARNGLDHMFICFDEMQAILEDSIEVMEGVSGKIIDRGTQRFLLSHMFKVQALKTKIEALAKEHE